MRAFVQTAIGEYAERDLPQPRARRGEVVLRMRAALTCGTDLKLLARGHARIELPVTMGHEVCGEIVEVGPDVAGFGTGDRVVPATSGPCGECADCRAGRENLCRLAGERMWGAFAELVRVPAGVVSTNLHPVPEGVEDATAAFLDPLASVLHGFARLGEDPETLLVYGAGALGLLWAAVARCRGVRCVVAGRQPERLRAAERFGARSWNLSREDAAEPFPDPGSLPDAAVDATGDPKVWMRLPELVAPGGRVLLFGGCAPGTRVEYDAARLHYSEISLVGAFHYTPAEAASAMELLASGEIDPRPLLSERGTLSDLPRFLQAQARGEGIRYAVIG